MAQFNYLSILGTVETAPVSKTLPTGTVLNEFVFAWEDSYASKAGSKVVNKYTIDVTVLDFLAKKLEAPLKVGDKIILEGHLRSSTWGQEGAKRTKHSITASNIVFMDNIAATPKQDMLKKSFPNSTIKQAPNTPQEDGVNFVDELPF